MNNSFQKLMHFINKLLFLSIACISFTPILLHNTSYMFMIGLLLLWFVTAFLHDATYFLTFRLMHLLLLFWIFYLMLLQVLHISDNNIGNLYTCLTFWLCIIFYDYYRNHMISAY